METQGRKPRSIKIVGHRNPDTDSVCAAIAYSRLKARLDPDNTYVPCRSGLLNRETKFVLKHFGVEHPRFFADASPTIEDVDYRRMPGVSADTSVRKAWSIMREWIVDTLCVVDENNRLIGVASIRDMTLNNMDIIDEGSLAKAGVSYQNVLETLDGTLLAGTVSGKAVTGRISTGAGSAEMMEAMISAGDVVIVSNRQDSMLAAIEKRAGCLVVCMDAQVPGSICRLAEEQGCVILSTPYSPYVAGQMIVQSIPIRHYMVTQDFVTFTPRTLVEDATRIMATVRHRYFPVLDEQRHYLGMLSRRNLLSRQKNKVILVDHNEKGQSVDGLDTAEVLEIIDHHRIGALETDFPVYFRNVPVGCTCTILYQMYRENGVEIDRSTAGLMLSAILSDTLMFRSPTCTAADEAAARNLAALAQVDLESYAYEMFEAGSDVSGKTPDEILRIDYKLFSCGNTRFGVSQNNYMTEKSRLDNEKLIAPYLQGFLDRQGLDMVFCMFTDVPSASTDLLMVGAGAEELVHRAFSVEVTDAKAVLPGMVSRKKQLIPILLNAIRQE